MNKDKIIATLKLKKFGNKGWMTGELTCPECGESSKFGVLFSEEGAVCRCMRCAINMPLAKRLREIGLGELVKDDKFRYQERKELPGLYKEQEVVKEAEAVLPFGFRRIHHDEYLESRGFTKEQYDQFNVGISSLDPHTRDKLIFPLYDTGKLLGWMARSRMTKEWHKENIRRHKELGETLILRYRNSENDFTKILGGADEITENTNTLILVEGLFDKANVDRLGKLNEWEEVKCCYTFGDDISSEQAERIPKTVEFIILMYDPDALKNMKNSGSRIMNDFDVKVAVIEYEGVDPGDMNAEQFIRTISNTKDFINYYTHLTGKLSNGKGKQIKESTNK